MANVVRDPRENPGVILPELSKPDPLVQFNKDQIALVYGSIWKQRYFTKIGDDYFVFPAQWDITHRVWRRYFVEKGTDWWAALYLPEGKYYDWPVGFQVGLNLQDSSPGGQPGKRLRVVPHVGHPDHYRRRQGARSHVSIHYPAMTDEYKIPNPCTSCHQDKPTSWWATEALHRWPERPPWRLE